MRKWSEISRYEYVMKVSNESDIYHMQTSEGGRSTLCSCSKWYKVYLLSSPNIDKVRRGTLRKGRLK